MKKPILLSLLFFISLISHSQELEGTITKENVTIGDCTFDKIEIELKVQYRKMVFQGKVTNKMVPKMTASYKITSSNGSDCKIPEDNLIVLEVYDKASGRGGYIELFSIHQGSLEWGRKNVQKEQHELIAYEYDGLEAVKFERQEYKVRSFINNGQITDVYFLW